VTFGHPLEKTTAGVLEVVLWFIVLKVYHVAKIWIWSKIRKLGVTSYRGKIRIECARVPVRV
jgi:hypothetical protein